MLELSDQMLMQFREACHQVKFNCYHTFKYVRADFSMNETLPLALPEAAVLRLQPYGPRHRGPCSPLVAYH